MYEGYEPEMFNETMTVKFNDYISVETQEKAKKLIKGLRKFRKTLR